MTEITQKNLSPRQLHHEAMDLAEIALRRKKEDKLQEASDLYHRAYVLEAQAAGNTFREPTRSILHKSAALLALEFGGTREAEKLIATCLSEEPPEGIAEELRNLLETVHFQRHLKLQGISLGKREFQFSIAGAGVDYGAAPSDAVLRRLGDVQKIIFRTAQRQLNIAFDKKSNGKDQISDSLTLYMEVARAQSYAITLRLGQKQGSENLFQEVDDFPSKVIDEVLECIDLVDREEYTILERKIGQDEYYRNFLALVKNIAPDGESISVVGFTSQNNNIEKQVKLTVPRKKINLDVNKAKIISKPKVQGNTVDDRVQLRGVLGAADSIKNRHQIQLVGDDGIVYTIIVPKELMGDIVRPNFQNYVKITGTWYGNRRLILEDLDTV